MVAVAGAYLVINLSRLEGRVNRTRPEAFYFIMFSASSNHVQHIGELE